MVTRLPRAAGAPLFVFFDFEFCRDHAPMIGLDELLTPSVRGYVGAVIAERKMPAPMWHRAWLQILPSSDPAYLGWRATQETQQ